MRSRRRMVERHLERVRGGPIGRWELARMADETFGSYARYWAESLRLPRLSRDEVAAGIAYDHIERIQASVDAGRGTILALPHLGGWEWAGTDLAMRGYSISVVAERLEPHDVFEWFVSFRRKLGMNVIATGPGAAAACVAALKDNHILCLLSDRLISGAAGVEVEFFGERTELPAGPATLAMRTGAMILPCAVYFGHRSNRHEGVVRPAVSTERAGRFREDVVRVTQDLAREFEILVKRAPTQWHLLQPNWPSDLAFEGPRPRRAAPPPAAPRSAAPRSAAGE